MARPRIREVEQWRHADITTPVLVPLSADNSNQMNGFKAVFAAFAQNVMILICLNPCSGKANDGRPGVGAAPGRVGSGGVEATYFTPASRSRWGEFVLAGSPDWPLEESGLNSWSQLRSAIVLVLRSSSICRAAA
jgi:hypothetical protein